jgi:hypothetical protein
MAKKPNISQFKTQRQNANAHTARGLGMLRDSIGRDGWIGGVTVAADGETFDGSARLETLADAMPDAEPIVVHTDGTRPVVVVRDDIASADDPRAKRLGLAANRVQQVDYAPDAEVLAQLAGEIDLSQFWNKDELAEIMKDAAGNDAADPGADTNRADELREKWQTELGQLWQVGRHRLLVGDCTVRENVARLMGDEKADATVTDPPYGVGVDYGSFEDTPENVRKLIAAVMPIIFEHLPAALTPGVPAMWDYPRPAWVGAWVHPAPVGGCPWGFVGNNPILYYGKDPYLQAGKGRRPDCVVMASDRQGEDGHPTPKPPAVWEWLVERLTPNPKAVVFDPFLGSGTTLVACERLGRSGRGCELSPAYAAVILERLAGLGLDAHKVE